MRVVFSFCLLLTIGISLYSCIKEEPITNDPLDDPCYSGCAAPGVNRNWFGGYVMKDSLGNNLTISDSLLEVAQLTSITPTGNVVYSGFNHSSNADSTILYPSFEEFRYYYEEGVFKHILTIPGFAVDTIYHKVDASYGPCCTYHWLETSCTASDTAFSCCTPPYYHGDLKLILRQ